MSVSSLHYHDRTGYDRFRMSGHGLDWNNQPSVFKEYPGLEPLLLPREVPLPEAPASEVLTGSEGRDESVESLAVEDLSRVFLLSCSLTAKARYPEGDFYFRSVASAGALYPTEVYVATQGVRDLEDGLYHFSILRHGLHPLRTGPACSFAREAIGTSRDENPSLVFFFTAILFRSAWKYRERAYRYHLLDTGHAVENLLLALRCCEMPWKLHYDFDDEGATRLLGLDGTREVVLAAVRVPGKKGDLVGVAASEPPLLPDRVREASRVSRREVDYPIILDMHRAGIGISGDIAASPDMPKALGLSPSAWETLDPVSSRPEKGSFRETVLRRRSRRNFVKNPLERDAMSALLETLCVQTPAACVPELNQEISLGTGFLMGDEGPLAPGFYLLDPGRPAFGPIAPGLYLEKMAHICLDQAWLRNACVHFLLLADLEGLDRRWGGRGYRYAMMTAGRLGQRLYLAATALGLGCCGIGAFYDGEAVDLLDLKGGKRLLYLVAVGQVKRA